MVDEIEISPSNRAYCQKCNQKIKKLEIRGCKKLPKVHPAYFCKNCMNIELSGAINKIEELKKEFDEFTKMTNKKREEYLKKLKILKKL